MSNIRAGTVAEANRLSGEWVFVDLGFASKKRTCGLLVGAGDSQELTFAQLVAKITSISGASKAPLNLVLEAPLSVAFGPNGSRNPTRRSVEKREGQSRYWYLGSGCCVLVAATYLLRSLHDHSPVREIRLFEGLVSFKKKGDRSSHKDDVKALRDVVWNPSLGQIISPEHLKDKQEDEVSSAFKVAGMDFGIPPVIEVR
jgi:hypothetical protein